MHGAHTNTEIPFDQRLLITVTMPSPSSHLFIDFCRCWGCVITATAAADDDGFSPQSTYLWCLLQRIHKWKIAIKPRADTHACASDRAFWNNYSRDYSTDHATNETKTQYFFPSPFWWSTDVGMAGTTMCSTVDLLYSSFSLLCRSHRRCNSLRCFVINDVRHTREYFIGSDIDGRESMNGDASEGEIDNSQSTATQILHGKCQFSIRSSSIAHYRSHTSSNLKYEGHQLLAPEIFKLPPKRIKAEYCRSMLRYSELIIMKWLGKGM